VITYKEAGVSLHANTRWVKTIEGAMRSTYGPRVLAGRHGGFAGLFRLDSDVKLFRRNYKKPVLVGCTDGVGTKVLLATQMKRLGTIGIDLVAMNVNDLITCGAEPLFFLDYLAVNKLEPPRLGEILEGIAAGCRESGCALLGGETAEMPAMYRRDEFDLAGFAVGVVEMDEVIDGSRVRVGDVLIGLPSSGVHSNGYSLVRKLVSSSRSRLGRVVPELGVTLGEALLTPTRIYVRSILEILGAPAGSRGITAMAHITGGGLLENIARVLPKNCDAVLQRTSWEPPTIFDVLRQMGTSRAEMFRVFNMGIGFVIVVRPRVSRSITKVLQDAGEKPIYLGEVVRGRQLVRFDK